MRNLSTLDYITFIILIIGGINWGLVGLFGIDLVGALFGPFSILSRIVYILVGLSALYVGYVVLRSPEKR